jgi:hypothetical protein
MFCTQAPAGPPCSLKSSLCVLHQLSVLHRSVKRPNLTDADRAFRAWLSQVWRDFEAPS